MTVLGQGLGSVGSNEEWLGVLEVELSTLRRFGATEDSHDILNTTSNKANCLGFLGRTDEALQLRREVFSRSAALPNDDVKCIRVLNLSQSLIATKRYEDTKMTAPRPTISARPFRRSRTLNRLRGASSVARIRS